MEDEADRRLAAARVVVVTQCGERFAYYTLSGTFILFCTKTLGVAPATADAAFSAWTALSFAAPLVGGRFRWSAATRPRRFRGGPGDRF